MKESIEKFVKYASSLEGDEKGEAQVFCDRFFQAFGHDGYKEAGVTIVLRLSIKKSQRMTRDLNKFSGGAIRNI